jgi:predicted DCC family thiol-disulfide oxidoreductase YuxK
MNAVAADPAPGKAVVLFDGDCPLCRMGVGYLRRLDWLGRLHYQNVRAEAELPPAAAAIPRDRRLDEMHVLTPDRKRSPAGFSAFRWMAWRLPLTLPLAPFLYLPGVRWAGDRVYRWVARNRFGLVPCRDGACAVPLQRK